ncbi:MAG: DUF5060 domain-containing protein [Reichenbachiella sp.]
MTLEIPTPQGIVKRNALCYGTATEIGNPIVYILVLILSMSSSIHTAEITATPMLWHKTTLTFEGPALSESGTKNPYRAYRLDVTFTGPSAQSYTVPGFYAADGDAAETGATSGTTWQVRFPADEVGEWSYSAEFTKGPNVSTQGGGTSAGAFDGDAGTFTVIESDKPTQGKDFRGKGKLTYTGTHHLSFRGSDEPFMKAGANSPEVFLQFKGFDNTNSDRTYPEHIKDWNTGDPTWKGSKGKGIIGAVNYLSSLDINAVYFLTMNHHGDGKEAFPWIDKNSPDIFDCSKLDQWEIVFEHFDRMGMMVHFVLTETENEAYFEVEENGAPGGFAHLRKLYYREMVARFGHHMAITWNIGEENGWAEGSGNNTANTNKQRRDFASHLRSLTYYEDHIVVHNGPSTDDYIFDDLYGRPYYTGPSLQWNFETDIHKKTLELRNKSIAADHPWVVSIDEPYTSPIKNDLTQWRKGIVWGNIMAGGAGAELYIGGGVDVTEQNYRGYAEYYRPAGYAAEFMMKHVPFEKMNPDDNFAQNAWTLKKAGSHYLLYLMDGGSTNVTLPEGTWTIRWFDPRNGGSLKQGSKNKLQGGSSKSIGTAPNNSDNDWAVLLTKKDTTPPDDPNPEITEGAFIETNGMLVIEAESTELVGKWEQKSEYSGYTGEGYVQYITNSTNFDPQLAEATLSYTFYIETSGTYRIKIRNYIPNDDMTEMNDLFFQIDTDTPWKSFSHTTWSWNWDFMHDDGDENFFEPDYILDTGEHTLKIIGRSDGFALDRIHMFLIGTEGALDKTTPESEKFSSTAGSSSSSEIESSSSSSSDTILSSATENLSSDMSSMGHSSTLSSSDEITPLASSNEIASSGDVLNPNEPTSPITIQSSPSIETVLNTHSIDRYTVYTLSGKRVHISSNAFNYDSVLESVPQGRYIIQFYSTEFKNKSIDVLIHK